MSADETALVAAVQAAPQDDAPRLVYADWLQEHGDEDRAAYLRAVVRLMHPPEDPADVHVCRRLANTIDEEWREAVGARFEVVLTGPGSARLYYFIWQAVVKIATHEPQDFWRADSAVRMTGPITREHAAAYVVDNMPVTGEQPFGEDVFGRLV